MNAVVILLYMAALSLIGFMVFYSSAINEINVVNTSLNRLMRVKIECLFRIIGRREGTVSVSFGVGIPRGRDCRKL